MNGKVLTYRSWELADLVDGVRHAMGDRTRGHPRALGRAPLRGGRTGRAARSAARRFPSTLKVLKATGLVDDETVGTRRIYRLNPAGVQALLDQLDTFWNRAIANYEAAIDDSTEDET